MDKINLRLVRFEPETVIISVFYECVRFNAQLGLRLNQVECSLASLLVAVEFMAVEKRNEWMNEWLNEQVHKQHSTQFFYYTR